MHDRSASLASCTDRHAVLPSSTSTVAGSPAVSPDLSVGRPVLGLTGSSDRSDEHHFHRRPQAATPAALAAPAVSHGSSGSVRLGPCGSVAPRSQSWDLRGLTVSSDSLHSLRRSLRCVCGVARRSSVHHTSSPFKAFPLQRAICSPCRQAARSHSRRSSPRALAHLHARDARVHGHLPFSPLSCRCSRPRVHLALRLSGR